MTFGQFERLSLYLTTALSILLIIITEEIAIWAWGAAALSLGIRAWLEGARRPPLMPKGTTAALFVIAFAFVDFFAIAPDILVAGVDMVLLLLVAKLLGPRTVRDNLQVIGLSFLLVLGSTVMSATALFGLIFLAYMFAGLWALLMQNLRAQWEATGNETRILQYKRGVLGRAFGVAVFGLGIGILFFTLTFYFLFPRVGIRWWSMSLGRQQAVSGFSSEVNLNDIGRIQQNPAVAVRVKFPEGSPEEGDRRRMLRGIHLDTYDDGRWLDSGRSTADNVFRAGRDRWLLEAGIGEAEIEIFPEESYAETLFLPTGSVSVRGHFQRMVRTASGNIVIERPAGVRTNYEVKLGSAATDSTLPDQRHLQVPEELRDYLGQTLAAWNLEGATPSDVVQRLLDRLQSEYAYTLSLAPEEDGDPVQTFLSSTRAGHCELFASSYALLLRVAGVPTRVVNGFAGGETWDENTVVFRELHAHSWVEAWLPGQGWAVFDPTPSTVTPLPWRTRLLHRMHQAVDRLRFFWAEWFVSYDLQRQTTLAREFRDASRRIGHNLDPRGLGSVAGNLKEGFRTAAPWAAGVVLVTAAGLLVLRRERHPGKVLRQDRLRKLYARRLRLAERLRPRLPGQTALGYARRLQRDDAELQAFVEYTELYYRLRFGQNLATPDDGMRFLALDTRMGELLKHRRRTLSRQARR